jgi:hypothetical protein
MGEFFGFGEDCAALDSGAREPDRRCGALNYEFAMYRIGNPIEAGCDHRRAGGRDSSGRPPARRSFREQ